MKIKPPKIIQPKLAPAQTANRSIDDIQKEISLVDSDLGSLNNQISSLDDEIAALDAQIAGADSPPAEAPTQLGALQNAVQSEIKKAKPKISAPKQATPPTGERLPPQMDTTLDEETIQSALGIEKAFGF